MNERRASPSPGNLSPDNVGVIRMAISPIGLNALLMLADADLHDLHIALSEEVECRWAVVDLGSGEMRDVVGVPDEFRVAVSIRRRSSAIPTWKPFLAGLGVPVDLTARPDAESVLIAVRTATKPARTVLWCFGSASLAVPNELVDGRFGLISALNKHTAGSKIDSCRLMPGDARSRRRSGDPAARVRQLNSLVRDGYRHSVLARSSAAPPVQGLRFDSASDLLRGVRVSTQDELMPDLEGARGLRFSTFVDSWSDLAVLADYLVDLRNRTDYRQAWEWVDHVVPVAPRGEVQRLLGVLHQLIVESADTPIDLVLPELGGAEPMPRLQFRMGREAAWSAPLEWRHVRRRLLQAPAGTAAALRRKIGSSPRLRTTRTPPCSSWATSLLLSSPTAGSTMCSATVNSLLSMQTSCAGWPPRSRPSRGAISRSPTSRAGTNRTTWQPPPDEADSAWHCLTISRSACPSRPPSRPAT
jgi:hypothetical protein